MTPSAPFNAWKIGKYFQKETSKVIRLVNINQNIKEDLKMPGCVQVHISNHLGSTN